MQRLFQKSKWIHKYLGLLLVIFLMWMSLSGILMNHPGLIANFSVPKWLVPPLYHIENWKRSALTEVVFSTENPQIAYAGGKQGIWKSRDGGRTFEPFMAGLPDSRYYRKTADILLLEGENDRLIAALQNGLYVCNLQSGEWRLLLAGEEKFLRIQHVKNELLAFSRSHIYRAPITDPTLQFTPVPALREEAERRVSLVKLFFDVHYGKAWGLPGLLFFDLIGLIMFFLSISAFFAWFLPWKKKRGKMRSIHNSGKFSRLMFKYMLKYHLKIGVWTAVFMAIVGGTGLFMRPPLLALLTDASIPQAFYPGRLPDNPWDHKIQNAVYDAAGRRIIISAEDGFWQAPEDFSQPFRRFKLDVPVFVMGATVLETGENGDLLIGSFSGLFRWQQNTGDYYNMQSGKKNEQISSVRPAAIMVTGYIRMPGGGEFINTHEQGVISLNGSQRADFLQQPVEITEGYRMPLWNYLFELHNARFFKSWIGAFNILVVPLGSMMFLLIVFSGLFDWFYLKKIRRKKPLPLPPKKRVTKLPVLDAEPV